MKRAGFLPAEIKVCIVRVTSYNDRTMAGQVYNPHFADGAEFKNSSELVFLMDGMFDEMRCPEQYFKRRSFSEKTSAPVARQLSDASVKSLATLKIDVQFRQNASWQGTLTWSEKNMEANFRSVLELLYLIDSIFEKNDTDSEKI